MSPGPLKDRFAGGLLGLAVADAIGACFEAQDLGKPTMSEETQTPIDRWRLWVMLTVGVVGLIVVAVGVILAGLAGRVRTTAARMADL